MEHHLYPVFLNLEQKKCLVVGGGTVAERKIQSLLEHGAEVVVVSPRVRDPLSGLHQQGLISWKPSHFSIDDLQGVYMAFITTNNAGVNNEIAEHCRRHGIMVNAVDDPPNCDFYVPSVLRRGPLAVAISTEGRSPMFAAHLRCQLGQTITEEYGHFVEEMGNLREMIKQSNLPINERRMVFEALINSDLLDLMLAGEKEKAEERIKQCIFSLQA